ncbi:HEPN domain-containing protein [Catalinimonas sp. 4WD22]|uniref:HEPN domain-containing protein n=1 Tax=Catalinimonas locisalis TaxID=3133978 RepID=UPI0031017601
MPGSKQDYIKYRIEKSEEIYQDAVLLAENERWNSCINRLYYSSFYLLSALLYQQGIKAETHNGTKTQFFLHFVKKGLTSKEYGKIIPTYLTGGRKRTMRTL